MSQHSLFRQMLPGESVSFDGGRLVVTVKEKSGRRACVTFSMRSDVVVDLPVREPAPVRRQPSCKSEMRK